MNMRLKRALMIGILLAGITFISGCVQKSEINPIELDKTDFKSGCLFPDFTDVDCVGYFIKDKQLWLLITNHKNETIFISGLGCNLKSLGTSYDVQQLSNEIQLDPEETAYVPSADSEGKSPSESNIFCEEDASAIKYGLNEKSNLRFALRYRSETEKGAFHTIVATIENSGD